MPGKTFAEGCDELARLVGDGTLHGEVTVDQVYAQFQHEVLDLKHPRGGQALYLHTPLMDHFREWLEGYASTVLEDGGRPAMIDAMEALAEDKGVAGHAPVELGDLRASGHPLVRDGGDVIYDRAPRQHRLSEEELKLKARAADAARRLGGFHHGEHGPGGLTVVHGST